MTHGIFELLRDAVGHEGLNDIFFGRWPHYFTRDLLLSSKLCHVRYVKNVSLLCLGPINRAACSVRGICVDRTNNTFPFW